MSTLVVLNEPESRASMVRWGFLIAQAYGEPLIFVAPGVVDGAPLQALSREIDEAWETFNSGVSSPEAPAGVASDGLDAEIELGPIAAIESELGSVASPGEEATSLAGASLAADEQASETSPYQVLSLEDTVDPTPVLSLVTEHKVAHLVLTKSTKKRERRDRSLVRRLFDAAPCMVVVLRPGQEPRAKLKRVMVPTAGGPHGMVALDLARSMTENSGATVVPVYVDVISTGPQGDEVANRRLSRVLHRHGIQAGEGIQPRTVVAKEVGDGVARACDDDDVDLLLLGESNVGVIRRTLFGTIPDRLMAEDSTTAIGVVRRRWPLVDRIRERLERFLDLTIPQLDRDDRVGLFDRIQSGSAWSFDFMLLIALSTTIAGLGLLQNSPAVVIGAMLVAPLMTPLLGAGLALVQGNLPLLLRATQAILLGFLSALGIGLLLGWTVPLGGLTPELLARGGPTVLDLIIGFLSGFAAAYCSGRPNLSAALPGVAIAAALVPPIATTGISISLGEIANARGAATLFGVNVVAIVVGAAAALYGGGVRPAKFEAAQKWRRYTLLVLIFILLTLTIPMSSWLLSDLRNQFRREFSSEARNLVEARVEALPGARIEDFAWKERAATDGEGNSTLALRLVLEAPVAPSRAWAESLEQELERTLEADVELRVSTRLLLHVDSPLSKP